MDNLQGQLWAGKGWVKGIVAVRRIVIVAAPLSCSIALVLHPRLRQILLQAAQRVEDVCDAVDINFGCPQAIAKNGHYGAFLQEDWDLIAKLVAILHEQLKVPVTCKIRILETTEKTVQYAKYGNPDGGRGEAQQGTWALYRGQLQAQGAGSRVWGEDAGRGCRARAQALPPPGRLKSVPTGSE